jgi:hypothetical protein
MSEEKGIISKITDAAASAGGFLKSAFGTVKEIQDLHVDYATKEKTYELLDKMYEAKNQLMEVQDLLISAKDRIIELENLINQKEDWLVEASKYKLLKTEAGSFVYTTIEAPDEDKNSPYYCSHCYSKKEISLLHPSPTIVSHGRYFIYYCPNCDSKFKMHKTPPIKIDVPIIPSSGW